MKVFGNISNIYKAYKTDKIENAKVKNEQKDSDKFSKTGAIKDKVTISQNAKIDNNKVEIEFIKQKLSQINDTNSDKISSLKQSIANGTYKMNLDKVADSLIDSIF
ncbi:flagellar biosynthesis anti-sigma factor FlgM [Haliovirga abyssi]|uniref:Negative regulator of flagellin synthesis n=1 Tax=Haliovirga abyssi TaxID=2996794 RepID=A0AAU9DUY5_9FUSO|nr:flagellar biosynthesis anti-sigma factor FlgM [Haliovirga abyssi]BDU51084.1 hypothetical protein HLVA_16530 [Haliovirga abyssi]